MLNYTARKSKITGLIIIGVIFLAIVVIAGSKRMTEASASQLQPQAIAGKNQEETIEFISAYRKDNQVNAEFCFLLPTSDDWQIGDDTTFLVGGDVFTPVGGFVSVMESEPNQKGQRRCITLLFNVPKDQEIDEATIQIQRLFTSRPEVLDCETAQRKIDQSEKFKGIVVKCKNETNTSGFEIVQKPAKLTEKEARKMVDEEIFSSVLLGPWIFPANIQ